MISPAPKHVNRDRPLCSIEAVVFPRSFSEHKEILKPESCIALKGRMSNRNGELSMVAEELKAL